MASSTILRIIFESNNRASRGIQQLNNDLQKQREELARLRAVEQARNAEANVGLVQQRNQLRVAQVAQQAQAAQAQIAESQQRNQLRIAQANQAVQKAAEAEQETRQRNQLRLVQAIERARRADIAAQLAQQRVSVASRNVRQVASPQNILSYQIALEQQQAAANRAQQAQAALNRIQQQGQVASARAAQANLAAQQRLANAQRQASTLNAQAVQKNVLAQQRLALVQQQASAASVRAVQQNIIAQQQLQNAQGGTNQSVSGLTALLQRFGGVGAIATATISAGFAALSVAAFGLARGLQDAAELEVRQVQVASTLIRVLDVSRERANQLVQDTISQITELGQGIVDTRLAVRLSDVILDEVAIGVQQVGGSQADITQLGAELSTRLASALTGQEERFGELQNVLADVLQGSQSLDQLQGRDILNDIGLNRVLIPLLRQRGVDNVADLSNFDRIEVLLEALRITESDENLLARANTVRGQFAVFLNKLFNPYTGLFGVNRDLEPNLPGQQTVFEAFKAVTIALIGKNGVFDNFGRLLESLGLNGDPLSPIRAALLGFNNFLIDVNRTLIQLRLLNDRMLDAGIDIRRVFDELGKVLDFLENLNPLRLLNPFEVADITRDGVRRVRDLGSPGTPSVGSPINLPQLPSIDILPRLPRLGAGNPIVNIAKGAIVVEASPLQNSEEVADMVLGKMDRLLGSELAGVGGLL